MSSAVCGVFVMRVCRDTQRIVFLAKNQRFSLWAIFENSSKRLEQYRLDVMEATHNYGLFLEKGTPEDFDNKGFTREQVKESYENLTRILKDLNDGD